MAYKGVVLALASKTWSYSPVTSVFLIFFFFGLSDFLVKDYTNFRDVIRAIGVGR